jgi:putative RNA 2'-phosphotransferase
MTNSDKSLGKFISLILRHKPEVINITLDEYGWADVDALISGIQKSYKFFNLQVLERIVEENNKNRYSFSNDKKKIRANQGHSINVNLDMKESIPPNTLYHGTATRFLNSILQQGITKQNRQFVHLSHDYTTARSVGARHGEPIVLSINSKQMSSDGHKFYLSANNVWQVDRVPPEYITQEIKKG